MQIRNERGALFDIDWGRRTHTYTHSHSGVACYVCWILLLHGPYCERRRACIGSAHHRLVFRRRTHVRWILRAYEREIGRFCDGAGEIRDTCSLSWSSGKLNAAMYWRTHMASSQVLSISWRSECENGAQNVHFQCILPNNALIWVRRKKTPLEH
jgi:hypothetical protein